MSLLRNNANKVADILKALGHPVRIEILQLLRTSRTNELTVTQIHESLDIPQPEASRHLIVMRNQSILLCEKREGHSFYHINPEYAFLQDIINHTKKR